MKRIKLTFIAVAAFILMAPACSKEDDSNTLPPATQVGANTFGCKINGVVYKCSGHKNADKWLAPDGCSFNLYDNKVSLDAWIIKTEKNNISIEFSYIEKN